MGKESASAIGGYGSETESKIGVYGVGEKSPDLFSLSIASVGLLKDPSVRMSCLGRLGAGREYLRLKSWLANLAWRASSFIFSIF